MLVYFKDDSAYTAIQFATLLNYQLTKKLVTRNRVERYKAYEFKRFNIL